MSQTILKDLAQFQIPLATQIFQIWESLYFMYYEE